MHTLAPRPAYAILAIALSSCSVLVCPEGLEESAGTCMPSVEPIDPTPDLDTGVDAPTDRDALVRIEWDVTDLPTDARVELSCNDRVITTQSGFTGLRTYAIERSIPLGQSCSVALTSARGLVLPAGRAINCSIEKQSWESQRGYAASVATFDVEACVPGCPTEGAENFSPNATLDDGSCVFLDGCTSPDALNYVPTATRDDGSCRFSGFGVIEGAIFVDDYPEDTEIALFCGGREVYSRDNFGSTPNITVPFRVLLDAGARCEFYLRDLIGDIGPGGFIDVCGVRVAEWSVQPGGLQPWQRRIAAFDVPSCSGCTNADAPEYDEDAYADDGTCTFTDIFD